MDEAGSSGPSIYGMELEGGRDLMETEARRGQETTHLYLLQGVTHVASGRGLALARRSEASIVGGAELGFSIPGGMGASIIGNGVARLVLFIGHEGPFTLGVGSNT